MSPPERKLSGPSEEATADAAPVLRFDQGTLLLEGLASDAARPEGFRYDARVGAHRAAALRYRDTMHWFAGREGPPLVDRARGYERTSFPLVEERTPFDHQSEALAAFLEAGARGTVVLPTGAGKTWVAVLAIARLGRPTLVVTPTLELVRQWAEVLERAFGVPVGLVGGGSRSIEDLTVTTYDSAWLKIEQLGPRFGFLVFDEVHHLPGASYATAAEGAIAPFRLGLTATPEREDGGEELSQRLVGPVVHRRDLREMAGQVLAPYETVRVNVRLTDEERRAYDEARGVYLDFVRSEGIRLGGPSGWTRFLAATSASTAGRRAFKAWRRQREIALGNDAKLRALSDLIARHASNRILVFAAANRTVHEISRRFLVPALTHETKLVERKELLAAFAAGELPILVTSQVLNEGVDVPEADVAVVLSGSSSVREHVQRLGRILRRAEGKAAVLYELVTEGSAEEDVSERRRRHDAWA